MSFLYQALIKEQQKGQQTKPDSTPEQGNFAVPPSPVQPTIQQQSAFSMAAHATPEQKGTSHWFWLVIASLLMLVGLLAGYLFASKTNSSSSEQQLYSSMQQQAELMQQKQQELEQSLSAIQKNTVNSAETEANEPLEVAPEDKQIEVAVDQDGQIQTQVTDIALEQEGSGQPLVRTILPELPMDEIPDALKSSFENAVKATEQKQNPRLFEAQVSTGSSLPLITELKLSDIYWVPNIEYQMHIYASEPSERWIRINDQTLNEGDALIDNLVLLEIRQDQIIWQGNNKRFAQNALEDFVKQ